MCWNIRRAGAARGPVVLPGCGHGRTRMRGPLVAATLERQWPSNRSIVCARSRPPCSRRLREWPGFAARAVGPATIGAEPRACSLGSRVVEPGADRPRELQWRALGEHVREVELRVLAGLLVVQAPDFEAAIAARAREPWG